MSAEEIIKQFEPEQHNLLNILHALQNNDPHNHLSEENLEKTALYLGLTKSAVYGVVHYYSMFSMKPRGRHIIRVCVSPVCELLKSKEVTAVLENTLGVRMGETTTDGLFTLEPSECLGQCQEAPSMMVNDIVYNQLDKKKIDDVIEKYRLKYRWDMNAP